MLKKILRKTIVVGRYIYFKMIGRKLRECRVITFHEISNINKFEEKIIFLKKNYSILPINELLNKRNDNSIAITFDDGYMEWSSEVYDLLDKYQVPALFFINSGLLYLTEDKQRKDYLKKNLNRVKELELLNIEGLKKISKNNLFTIGGHTINHLNLGLKNSLYSVQGEVLGDKEFLENIIDKKIEHFALPFGRLKNINKEAAQVLRKSGYKYIFSIIPSTVDETNIIPRDSLSIYDSELFWRAWLGGAYDFKSKKEFKLLQNILSLS